MLKDQQALAKQMDSTGKALAQLTINQMRAHEEIPSSPTSSDTSVEQTIRPRRAGTSRAQVPAHNGFHSHRTTSGDRHMDRAFLPKMNFPRFDGHNPCIWKDKCQDYFKLLNIPESMWATAASLHMDANAEKWL